MHRIKKIYDQTISFESLYKAAKEVAKEDKDVNLRFMLNLEDRLHDLHDRLKAGDIPVVRYYSFLVFEPKARLVICTDLDTKIIQRAVYDNLAPLLNRRMIEDTYSCIDNRGQLAAITRLHEWFACQTGAQYEIWYGKHDVKKFFYRIVHDILMDLIERRIADKRMLKLLEYYICNTGRPFGLPYGADPVTVKIEDMLWDRGIPIGGGMSHMLGNVYLDPLDQFAKRELGIDEFIRYMDDNIHLGKSLYEVESHGRAMDDFVRENLDLQFNHKTAYRPVRCGCEFVGVRIYPDKMLYRKSTTLRMKRNLKAKANKYHDYELDYESVRSTVASYKAMLKHTNNVELDRKIWSNFVLTHADRSELPEYDSTQYKHIIKSIQDGIFPE